MGTYRLEYGGKTQDVFVAVNLKTAIQSLGFVVRDIEPDWHKVSNGKYRVTCMNGMIIHATWLEKTERLKS